MAQDCRTQGKSEVGTRTVLVVDDDPILREVMTEKLRSLGWTVSDCENGEAAIAFLAKELPDLAIIDISMPELDGFELLRHLRQNPRPSIFPSLSAPATMTERPSTAPTASARRRS